MWKHHCSTSAHSLQTNSPIHHINECSLFLTLSHTLCGDAAAALSPGWLILWIDDTPLHSRRGGGRGVLEGSSVLSKSVGLHFNDANVCRLALRANVWPPCYSIALILLLLSKVGSSEVPLPSVLSSCPSEIFDKTGFLFANPVFRSLSGANTICIERARPQNTKYSIHNRWMPRRNRERYRT